MKLGHAEQYQKSCILLEVGDEADDIIEYAELEEAVFWEGPKDKAYVVQFPGRPKELYSERALRHSLPIKAICRHCNESYYNERGEVICRFNHHVIPGTIYYSEKPCNCPKEASSD